MALKSKIPADCCELILVVQHRVWDYREWEIMTEQRAFLRSYEMQRERLDESAKHTVKI